MANKYNHLLDAYRQLKQQAGNVVLATLVETTGSTYRKAGARMVIARDGQMNGLLGGGCFERDLMEQALSVFESGQPKTVFYDMRSPDDVIWGLGLGCNGAVRVFLQLLSAEDDFKPLDSFAEAATLNVTGILITTCESDHPDFDPGSHWFLPASTLIDRQRLIAIPFPFTTSARQTFAHQKSRFESHVLDGKTIKVFYDLIQPPTQLLVLGAGADAVPVVRCAKALGWHVTVVDHRPGHIKQERFPEADQLLCLPPEDLNEYLELDRFNALVLMTHNIEYDERYLKVIAGSRIPFIGLLGPEQRRDRLLRSLAAEALSITDRVFGPIGLDLGAETPEEIALSIMAGIHAALNGRGGGQLGKISVPGSNECDHECVQR
ncbi:MAG: XdhC family protein [Gammaproteobacteria bacterium]